MFKYLYLGKIIPAVSIIAEQCQGDGDLILSRRRREVPGGGGSTGLPGFRGLMMSGAAMGVVAATAALLRVQHQLFKKKPVLVKRCVLFMISKMEFKYIEYNYL